MMFKFLLLLFIGLVLLALVFYNRFFNGRENSDFEVGTGYIHMESNTTERTNSHENEKKEEVQIVETNDEKKDTKVLEINPDMGSSKSTKEFDYETIVQQRTGKAAYKSILQNAEQAMNLLVSGDLQGWEEIATSNLIDKISEGEIQLSYYTKVDSLEVFPTKQVNEKDVIIGSMISAEDDVKSYQLIFVEVQGVYLIDEIVLMWSN